MPDLIFGPVHRKVNVGRKTRTAYSAFAPFPLLLLWERPE